MKDPAEQEKSLKMWRKAVSAEADSWLDQASLHLIVLLSVFS
jgi:hypothetical protein